MNNNILFPLLRELKIPPRIINILSWYLISLMIPAQKHTQVFASKLSGKASSLFSNLLSRHFDLSLASLNRAVRRRIRRLKKKKSPLIKGAPWTIGIIIDATLQSRSSRKCENAQVFNHGTGYKFGHQWTNIGVLLGGELIPLPPIPFETKKFSLLKGKAYRTEADRVAHLIRTLNLKDLVGDYDPSEILFLMDSGYDSKKIQNSILSREFDFIVALRADRSVSISGNGWGKVSRIFNDGRRPWKTIRLKAGSGKTRVFRIKQKEGNLKGVSKIMNLVCSKKRDGKIKHFACSNCSVSGKVMIEAYQLRWKIEIFHREVKSYLGFEDSGSHHFISIRSHVHWSYLAYILLKELSDNSESSVKEQQQLIEATLKISDLKEIVAKTTRINSKEIIKKHCLSAIQQIKDRAA